MLVEPGFGGQVLPTFRSRSSFQQMFDCGYSEFSEFLRMRWANAFDCVDMTHFLGVGKRSCHISIPEFQPNFLERWDFESAGNERKRARTPGTRNVWACR